MNSPLTRRVAEYSQIDPADIEADARNSSERFPRVRRATPRVLRGTSRRERRPSSREPRRRSGGAEAKPPASRERRSRSPPRGPKKAPDFRRSSKYQTIRTLDELNAVVAASINGHVAVEAKASSIDPMQAEISGIALALAANDAGYSRSPTGNPATAPDCSTPALRRTRSGLDDALDSAEADPGIAGHPQDRLQRQVQRGDAGAARHRGPQSSTMRN